MRQINVVIWMLLHVAIEARQPKVVINRKRVPVQLDVVVRAQAQQVLQHIWAIILKTGASWGWGDRLAPAARAQRCAANHAVARHAPATTNARQRCCATSDFARGWLRRHTTRMKDDAEFLIPIPADEFLMMESASYCMRILTSAVPDHTDFDDIGAIFKAAARMGFVHATAPFDHISEQTDADAQGRRQWKNAPGRALFALGILAALSHERQSIQSMLGPDVVAAWLDREYAGALIMSAVKAEFEVTFPPGVSDNLLHECRIPGIRVPLVRWTVLHANHALLRIITGPIPPLSERAKELIRVTRIAVHRCFDVLGTTERNDVSIALTCLGIAISIHLRGPGHAHDVAELVPFTDDDYLGALLESLCSGAFDVGYPRGLAHDVQAALDDVIRTSDT